MRGLPSRLRPSSPPPLRRHFSIWRITRSLLAGCFVSVGFPSLRAGPGGSIAGRRHGHIRCRLGFQVVRMRRADGAALAVRQERLVSRSSLTLEPPACSGARGRHSRRPSWHVHANIHPSLTSYCPWKPMAVRRVARPIQLDAVPLRMGRAQTAARTASPPRSLGRD